MLRPGLRKAAHIKIRNNSIKYYITTYGIFFLASKLTRGLEVYTKIREFAFIILANILDGIDMEWDSKTMERKNNCLSLPVDKDLHI